MLLYIGKAIAGLDVVGAGIYAFLNRLLIPTGLHHALNNVFWFDTIGLGDLTHFWAGETSKNVSWSLGMYMSGFFPCMMFGIPGAALAMIQSQSLQEKGCHRFSCICSYLCICLWCNRAIRVRIYVPCTWFICYLRITLRYLYNDHSTLGFRAGFSFSAGAMTLYSHLPSGSTEDMADHSSWNRSFYRILCCIPFRDHEI